MAVCSTVWPELAVVVEREDVLHLADREGSRVDASVVGPLGAIRDAHQEVGDISRLAIGLVRGCAGARDDLRPHAGLLKDLTNGCLLDGLARARGCCRT